MSNPEINPKFHPQLYKNLEEFKVPAEVINTYTSFLEAISESFNSFQRKIEPTPIHHDKLLNAIENVVFQLDWEFKICYINKAIQKYTGHEVSYFIGKHFSALFECIDLPAEKVETIFDTRITGHVEKVIPIRFGNNRKWFRVQADPVVEDGKCAGAIGSMVDITDLKVTELELVKASKAKSDFLSTMSHEIRTPLNAVIGMSNLLKMQEYLPEQEENLNAMKFASEHLLGLINDILDYNKIEAGKITFSKTAFNIHEMLLGLLRTFNITAKEKNLLFEVVQDFNLDYFVIADRTRLFQVLTNLIGNALKFTENGTVHLNVSKIMESEEGVELRFEVKDTGIGIPTEKLEMIFEQFSQIDSSINRSFTGTGLGLAISSRLLGMQDSKLYVESEEGIGSSFYFNFTFLKGESFQNLEKNAIDIASIALSEHEPIEILMAEDNIMNVLLIKRFFKLWNIRLEVVHNGQEAIEKVKERDFDLILMDIQMPVMDGFKATREIRALDGNRFKEVPIIALTASVDVQYRSQASDIGMNDFLTKPFAPEEFRQKILQYHLLNQQRRKKL